MSRISELLDRYSLYVALMAAWIAMLGSLYFSQVRGYVPCELCWYQRILMYPLTVVLAVGLLRKDNNLTLFVLPLSSLGFLVALYHYLLEKTDIFPAHECSAGVSCTAVWINWFGFITIPFLSLVAFTIITLMCIIAWQAGEPFDDGEVATPWLPVGAVVGIVSIIFAALFVTGNQERVQAQSAAAATGQSNTNSQINTSSASSAGSPAATQLYAQACASCHGPNAEGVAGLGTALAGAEFIKQSTDQEILTLIRAGRGLTDPQNTSGLVMPPSGGRPDLNDGQLLEIIQVIRGL